MRSCGKPARRRTPRSLSCDGRPRPRVPPSRWRGSKSKGSHLSPVFCLLIRLVWDPLPIFVFCLWFSSLWTAQGNTTTQAQAFQTAYNFTQ
jgi:hypothetical protein